MYNPGFMIVGDYGSSSSLVFFSPKWAKFPCRCIGLLFLVCHVVSISSCDCTLLVTYNCLRLKVVTNTCKTLWGCSQIPFAERMMRTLSSSSSLVLKIDSLLNFPWLMQNIGFPLILLLLEKISVVGDLVHLISSSKVPQFLSLTV